MKKLLPHQEEAVKAVTKELSVSDRTHIVMACGTGKTFTALKIAERMAPKSVVVFLPSLALINQFMKEWIRETKLRNLVTLTICCDETVANGIEDESLLYEEVDFPVSNNIEEIKNFVKLKNTGPKFIFCTYQSSHLLAEASKRSSFDLAIFDEAHKTAGYEKEKFSCTLFDSNIKIKKRLFMTATPRHAHATKRDKNGDPISVFSMDNEQLYGKRIYTLGFRDAINLGLICDYKVIISVANANANANANIESNVCAVAKAVRVCDAKKIITYHASIRQAREFAQSLRDSNALKGFNILHVNGAVPLKDRADTMHRFKHSKKSIITNSRCLTEGIDVPAIDMVSFLNPKSSKIDIVQAIGRALRNSSGKSKGYIFLPIFLDKSAENQELEIQNSEFSHIWDVLNVLSEEDRDLNDVIKDIARESGESREDDSRSFEKYIQIDDNCSPEFIKSIKARILDNLGSGWDTIYGKLKRYLKNNPKEIGTRTSSKYFAYWISKQKFLLKQNLLSEEKINLLNELGLDLYTREFKDWEIVYNLVREEWIKNKNCFIEKGALNTSLTKWCALQRDRIRNKKISPKQHILLNSMNFPLNLPKKRWFIDLENYKKAKKSSQYDKSTYDWGYRQRNLFYKGNFPEYKVKALKEAGFDFEKKIQQFDYLNESFDKHKDYKEFRDLIKVHGCIPRGTRAALIGLSKHLKDLFKQGRLNKKSIEILKGSGFIFPSNVDPKTERKIKEYLDFCNTKKKLNYKCKIWSWITAIRRMKNIGKLSKDVENRLNEINFPWRSDNDHAFEAWLAQYNELRKYIKKLNSPSYGFCADIPKKVINFRASCRNRYRAGLLDDRRIKLLEKINFDWGSQ